jgi:hypothetical protein
LVGASASRFDFLNIVNNACHVTRNAVDRNEYMQHWHGHHVVIGF